MPPVPPPLAKDATARTAGAPCSREVIVDVPPTIGLLPGEIDLIVSMLGEALTEMFSEEDNNAAGRRGHQLQDEKT
jgi:hypothetical protein